MASPILLHAKDNESDKQQVNTTTLSLKSIVGHEKEEFNKLSKQESSLSNSQKETLEIIRRLTNVINNLYRAAEEMCKLYSRIYLVRNKMYDYYHLIEDWNYVPCNQNSCDATYGCGGSYTCNSCYGGACISCNVTDSGHCAGEGCSRRE